MIRLTILDLLKMLFLLNLADPLTFNFVFWLFILFYLFIYFLYVDVDVFHWGILASRHCRLIWPETDFLNHNWEECPLSKPPFSTSLGSWVFYLFNISINILSLEFVSYRRHSFPVSQPCEEQTPKKKSTVRNFWSPCYCLRY